jgi:hypothetical protein
MGVDKAVRVAECAKGQTYVFAWTRAPGQSRIVHGTLPLLRMITSVAERKGNLMRQNLLSDHRLKRARATRAQNRAG